VAAENASAAGHFLGKSLLIESKDSGRANNYAGTVLPAQAFIHYNSVHNRYSSDGLVAKGGKP
jgi:hypothetical protein